MKAVLDWLLPLFLYVNFCCLASANPKSSCRCVPYYQCDDKLTSTNAFGNDRTTERRSGRETCDEYLSVCCPFNNILGEKIVTSTVQPDIYQKGFMEMIKSLLDSTMRMVSWPFVTINVFFIPQAPGKGDVHITNLTQKIFIVNGTEIVNGTKHITDECYCVPYYACDENDRIYPDGLSLIRSRVDLQNTKNNQLCDQVLYKCCKMPNLDNNSSTAVPLPSPPPYTKKCGQRNRQGIDNRAKSTSKSETHFGEFPWVVAIIKEEGTIAEDGKTSHDIKVDLFRCAGSLIHPMVVLTTAHCIDTETPVSFMKIRAGEWDTQTTDEPLPHQERFVRQIIVHEDFNRQSLSNDFALLILQFPVDINYENIGIVCLPNFREQIDESRCVVNGWGKNYFEILGKNSRNQLPLKKGDLSIVSKKECERLYRFTPLGVNFELHNSFICANHAELYNGVCKIDGDGPLVCPIKNQSDPDKYVQVGILSWGIACGHRLPGVYANVAVVRKWIDQKLTMLGFDVNKYQVS